LTQYLLDIITKYLMNYKLKLKNPLIISVLKDISILTSGVLIAQTIPILLQPILKRQFAPEEFGIYDIYFRLVSLFSVLITFRYERAIVLSKTKLEAYSLTSMIFIITTLFLIITESIILIFNDFWIEIFNIPQNRSYVLYLFPLTAYFYSITITLHFLFIFRKKMNRVSSNKILRRLFEGGSQISFGILKKHYGLVLGDIIGNLCSLLHAASFSYELLKYLKSYSRVKFNRGIAILKLHSDFPKYSLISNLLNTFVLSALTFQVLSKFNIQDVGFMELTQRVLIIPSAIMGVSLGQVLLQRSAESFNKFVTFNSIIKLYFIISIIIIVPYLLIFFFLGEDIFKLFFGSQWVVSARYSSYLLVSTGIMFIASPLGQILIGLNKIRLNSIWEYFKFLLIISLFLIPFKDIDSYLRAYNLMVCLAYLVYLIIIFISLKKYNNSIKLLKNSD